MIAAHLLIIDDDQSFRAVWEFILRNSTAMVETVVSEGKTNEGVLVAFAEMYGERVLAAPTRKGFNLAAWILPFVLTSAGEAGLYFWISRWTARRRRQEAPIQGPGRPSAEVSRYEELLDEELEKLDL